MLAERGAGPAPGPRSALPAIGGLGVTGETSVSLLRSPGSTAPELRRCLEAGVSEDSPGMGGRHGPLSAARGRAGEGTGSSCGFDW